MSNGPYIPQPWNASDPVVVTSAMQAALTGKLASSVTKAELNTAVSDGNVVYVGDGLNGTLGATTPSTVAATTVNASGTVTLPQDAWSIYAGTQRRMWFGSDFVTYSEATQHILRSTTGVVGLTVVSGTAKMGLYTVATLPSASSNTYCEANVSDSLAPSIGSTVASGGSAKAKVWSNGTNWIVVGK